MRVKGKAQAVTIFYPVAVLGATTPAQELELKTWRDFLQAYRAQNWNQCDLLLSDLLRMNAEKYLYQLYSGRVAARRLLAFDPAWDGTTNFQSK